MAYFMINDVDFSNYVNELSITESANYNAQTNARGNTTVDYINSKRTIDVGIIPLNDTVMKQLQTALSEFSMTIKVRSPKTNELEAINCILPKNGVQYYTIQVNKVLYQAFSITFSEL